MFSLEAPELSITQHIGAGPTAGNPMSTLQQLLNSQDAALGPWVPGRDPLEDALSAFAGAPGGPPAHPWMAGLVAGPASDPGAYSGVEAEANIMLELKISQSRFMGMHRF